MLDGEYKRTTALPVEGHELNRVKSRGLRPQLRELGKLKGTSKMSRFLEAHLASLAIGSAVALGFYVFYGPSGSSRQKRGDLRGLVRISFLLVVVIKLKTRHS